MPARGAGRHADQVIASGLAARSRQVLAGGARRADRHLGALDARRESPSDGDQRVRTMAGVDNEYERLRHAYRPAELRYLLIGESPPDPQKGDMRFFYAPRLHIDNLYPAVAEAVYGLQPWFDVSLKPAVLTRLQCDGFWLVDAVDTPINRHSAGARRAALIEAVPRLAERCRELCPTRGVVICHGVVYRLAAPALRAAGVPVLHDRPLPFPLGNWRKQFVEGFRAAVA